MGDRPTGVQCEPKLCIAFHGPYDSDIKEEVKMSNSHPNQVWFRLKLSKNCRNTVTVKPEYGVIPPKKSANFEATLKPLTDSNTPTTAPLIFVKWMFAIAGKENNADTWDNPDVGKSSRIMRCDFDFDVEGPGDEPPDEEEFELPSTQQ